MIDLVQIAGELMLDGYSEAVNLKIGVAYSRMRSSSAKSKNEGREWRILIDRGFADSSEGVVKGLLSHELSHIIKLSNLKPHTRRSDLKLYNSRRLYRERDERNTDLDVILRGHGRDLLSYKMSEVSKGENGGTGLTLYEIKKLIGMI